MASLGMEFKKDYVQVPDLKVMLEQAKGHEHIPPNVCLLVEDVFSSPGLLVSTVLRSQLG